MSSDEPKSPDLDGDGIVTAEELSSIKSLAKSAPWTLAQAVEKARSEGARLTKGARSLLLFSGDSAVDRVIDSVASLANFVIGTVMDRIVKPLFTSFFWVPAALAATISVVFWGQDLALEKRVQGFPGLADMPILVANLIHDATAPIGQSILVFLRSTNQAVVTTLVQEGGGFAPVLIALWQILALGALVYLLWSGVQLAGSLPVISTLVAGGRVVTRPFRGFLGRFR